MSLVTGLFFLVLLVNQRWSPPHTLQASHCSTFRIMCDVPSTTVFCSESIECFPGIASKFFLKLPFTIPVAPIITGTIVHLRFHIRCISIHKLLYFNFFSASFCTNYYYYYYYYYKIMLGSYKWNSRWKSNWEFIHFPPLTKVSTDNTSVDLQLHITAREDYFGVMTTLNMQAVNMQSFRRVCKSMSMIIFIEIKTSK